MHHPPPGGSGRTTLTNRYDAWELLSMPTYIGFDRRIALAWLDETAGQMLRDPDPAAVRTYLHTALAGQIAGSEARIKTITLLCRIWVNPPHAPHLRDEALTLLPTLLPGERLWLHWGLCILAFPFFRDVVGVVGKLSALQGQCSLGQVTDRMIANWGERSTLIRATQRVLRSCVDWGTLDETTTVGIYQPTQPRATSSIPLRDWFLEAALRGHDTDGVVAGDLARLPEMYPFAPAIQPHEIQRLSRFESQQQGGGTMLIYPAHRVGIVQNKR
jgi:hypothetical protein